MPASSAGISLSAITASTTLPSDSAPSHRPAINPPQTTAASPTANSSVNAPRTQSRTTRSQIIQALLPSSGAVQVLIGLAGLMLTILGIRWMVRSYNMALWTEVKDFRDDCRNSQAAGNVFSKVCDAALHKALNPPPYTSLPSGRRMVEHGINIGQSLRRWSAMLEVRLQHGRRAHAYWTVIDWVTKLAYFGFDRSTWRLSLATFAIVQHLYYHNLDLAQFIFSGSLIVSILSPDRQLWSDVIPSVWLRPIVLLPELMCLAFILIQIRNTNRPVVFIGSLYANRNFNSASGSHSDSRTGADRGAGPRATINIRYAPFVAKDFGPTLRASFNTALVMGACNFILLLHLSSELAFRKSPPVEHSTDGLIGDNLRALLAFSYCQFGMYLICKYMQ